MQSIPSVSPEEYLDQEAVAESRHTYFAGLITAMAGGSVAHGTITGSLVGLLFGELRGRGCRVVSGRMS